MKLLTLLTPCAMLPGLWLLQRLEVWITETPDPPERPRVRSASNAVPPVRIHPTGSRRG